MSSVERRKKSNALSIVVKFLRRPHNSKTGHLMNIVDWKKTVEKCTNIKYTCAKLIVFTAK